ncbi:MAG: hypothetical protein AB7N76_01205 [Planctomycetota bacterium]
MKRVLSLALTLFLAAPALAQDSQPTEKPAAKDGDVEFPSAEVAKEDAAFKVKPAQPGEVRSEAASLDVDMKMHVDMGGGQGQDMNQKMTSSWEREVTITGAEADGTITALKVKFTKFAEKQSMGGMGGPEGGDEKKAKLEGKTFTVETLDDKSLEIKDDAGAKVEDFFVRRQVQQAANSAIRGAKDGFHSALPKDGALKPGQKLDSPEQPLRAMLDMQADEKVKFEKKELVYKGTRTIAGKKCGVFDIRVTISQDAGAGPVMSMILGGEVALDLASGRVLLTHLGGKLKLDGSDPNGPSVTGGGVVKVKLTSDVK